MNKKLLLAVTFLCAPLIASNPAAWAEELDLSALDVVVMLLEKNVMRIERYNMKELQEGDNEMPRKVSNSHCSHLLHLGERGLHVQSISQHPSQVDQLKVITFRGKKEIEFSFNWAKLLLDDPAQAHETMFALVKVEVAEQSVDLNVQAQDFAAIDQMAQENQQQDQDFVDQEDPQMRKVGDKSTIVIDSDLAQGKINLIYDRQIEAAVILVFPHSLSNAKQPASIQIFKKAELMQSGLLSRVDYELGEITENAVVVEHADQSISEDVQAKALRVGIHPNDENTDKNQAALQSSKERGMTLSKWAALFWKKLANFKEYLWSFYYGDE